MSRKKWNVSKIDKELASQISSKYDIDPFAALLLVSRGITSQQAIEDFFSEDFSFCDPFELKDMDKAVERIEAALERGERIAVYGDYDADGVTATAVLFLYLEMIGADVTYYIPDRNTEGYGLNKNSLLLLSQRGVKLIITVDNGISAINEAQYAYELGMEIVVTDHHKVGSKLPRAYAVVDAHRPDCTSSYKEWSGVGIVFKLLCALSGGEWEDILDSYSDIIAIGTIGDIVPLIGENRAIVKHGLKKINSGNNCGIEALREVAGAGSKTLVTSSVAYTIVPRINAAGRIESAQDAFQLLISDSSQNASDLAAKIDFENSERQRLEQEIMQEVYNQLAERPETIYDRVLVFSGFDWHGGVIGIVASRLVELFGKPCFVITDDGEEARGSARSIDGFSLYEAVSSCSQLLTHYGGHTLAAGFSLKSENIENFKKAINDYAKTVDMPFAKIRIDCKLKPEFISADILPVIEKLEPFGAGNEQPVFGLFSMTLVSVKSIGNGKHVRLTLKRGETNISALKFGQTAEDFPYVPGDVLDLAVRLEKNEYRGQVKASIFIKEIRMSATDDEKYLCSKRLYEKIKREDRITRSEAALAVPDRKYVADVFRFIKANGGWNFDFDILCYRLGDDGTNACKIMVCIDILSQLGIFEKKAGQITLANISQKVNLDDSPLLKRLRMAAKSDPA